MGMAVGRWLVLGIIFGLGGLLRWIVIRVFPESLLKWCLVCDIGYIPYVIRAHRAKGPPPNVHLVEYDALSFSGLMHPESRK